MKVTNLFKFSMKEEKGFTLIELMIVVGIIGILVAIAAPNFARYQSKARQSEAKIALSAIYAGEKSFYSEYSAYASSMDSIGYTPEGNKRYYTVGFSTGDSVSVTGFAGTPSAQPKFVRINFPSTWTTCTSNALAATAASGATDPQTFTSQASGQVRMSTACDVWDITDTKLLSNSTVSL